VKLYSIAKIFDRPRRFPVRSIPAILNLIEEYAQMWSLPERNYLENMLSSGDYNSFEGKSNEQISLEIVNFFRQSMPSFEKKDRDELSSALDCVFQSRDKVHAHNESIPKTERKLPSWTDTKILTEYTEEFIKTISRGFFGWAEIVSQPEMMSKQLEMIMGVSNLVSEDYVKEEDSAWFIEELRKELFGNN